MLICMGGILQDHSQQLIEAIIKGKNTQLKYKKMNNCNNILSAFQICSNMYSHHYPHSVGSNGAKWCK
jgi:hypothetical protein